MAHGSETQRRSLSIALILTTIGLVLFQCLAWPRLNEKQILTDQFPPKIIKVIEGAKSQIGVTTSYDPTYKKLDYPNGDVSVKTGVCTDVIIRALRKASFDLQKEVHKSMKSNFHKYPKNWNLKAVDKNIDHRRVPNLQTFFKERGWAKEITNKDEDYKPGDIVTWKLSNGRDHIGLLIDRSVGSRPLVIHNIGWGASKEDVLFSWEITGHYRPEL